MTYLRKKHFQFLYLALGGERGAGDITESQRFCFKFFKITNYYYHYEVLGIEPRCALVLN